MQRGYTHFYISLVQVCNVAIKKWTNERARLLESVRQVWQIPEYQKWYRNIDGCRRRRRTTGN